jgi:hypothetical protein
MLPLVTLRVPVTLKVPVEERAIVPGELRVPPRFTVPTNGSLNIAATIAAASGALTLSSGSTLNLTGTLNVASGDITLNGGNIVVKSGGTFAKPGSVGWGSPSAGGSLIIESGGTHTIDSSPWAGSGASGQYQIGTGGKLTITPPSTSKAYWAYAIDGPVSLLKNGTATSADVAVPGTFYDALTVKSGAVFTVTGAATGLYADDPARPGIRGEGNGKIVLLGAGKEIGVDRNSVTAVTAASYTALPGIVTTSLHTSEYPDTGPWSDIDGYITTATTSTTFTWNGSNAWGAPVLVPAA